MELVENVAAATTAAIPILQTVAPDAVLGKWFIERLLLLLLLLKLLEQPMDGGGRPIDDITAETLLL